MKSTDQYEREHAVMLGERLGMLIVALWDLLAAFCHFLLPWAPLLLWIAFWLVLVDWRGLWQVLSDGAWVGLLLIGIAATVVWGVVAPGPQTFVASIVPDPWEKVAVVAGLYLIMMVCGLIQPVLGVVGRILVGVSPRVGDG